MIAVFNYQRNRNWGDLFSPTLVEKLSGDEVACYKEPPAFPHYLVIGSLLRFANRFTTVWGGGFIAADAVVRNGVASIRAVRGRLTRNKLLKQGIQCPAIYADPGLLYARLFGRPDVPQEYTLGIVPHYVDADHPSITHLAQEDNVHVIDIAGDIHDVPRQVCRCKHIASSSLHGLILADQFGIPSTWISISGQLTGGSFKFHDYFTSCMRSRSVDEPVQLIESTTVSELIATGSLATVFPWLDQFVDHCPF